jgi:type VI secretion system secreted protein VgrG
MPRRRLRSGEIREAQEIFASDLPYALVWVHEHARWPIWLAVLGSALRRRPPPAGGNAVTLGRSVYFPRPLRTEAADFEARLFDDMAWLIHELTHVWQYGHRGYRYALDAVRGQLQLGSAVYDYGGAKGLAHAAARHASLSDFNPEQQGDMVRDYYLRRKVGATTVAWEPFMEELRVS